MSIFKFIKEKKKGLILAAVIAAVPFGITTHELSVRYFQDKTCVVCHEMKDPIEKWKQSGTAKNHNNCASCHFDPGFKGWMDMNKSAVRFLIEHFKRDPNEPIRPKEEPLILEEGREPGYWSHVPNSRCFTCKNVDKHKKGDQVKIHSKLIKGITSQPCKDCHNHEMRNGQKFYEKVSEKDPKTSS